METYQEIKILRILKKLEDAKKDLHELYNDTAFPLKESERNNVTMSLDNVNKAINCL